MNLRTYGCTGANFLYSIVALKRMFLIYQNFLVLIYGCRHSGLKREGTSDDCRSNVHSSVSIGNIDQIHLHVIELETFCMLPKRISSIFADVSLPRLFIEYKAEFRREFEICQFLLRQNRFFSRILDGSSILENL